MAIYFANFPNLNNGISKKTVLKFAILQTFAKLG